MGNTAALGRGLSAFGGPLGGGLVSSLGAALTPPDASSAPVPPPVDASGLPTMTNTPPPSLGGAMPPPAQTARGKSKAALKDFAANKALTAAFQQQPQQVPTGPLTNFDIPQLALPQAAPVNNQLPPWMTGGSPNAFYGG